MDPNLRGAIWGLSLRHRPEHIFRAIMEGVAYGTEYIFRTFREAGYAVSEISACGGATRSRLWMQIHSDVSGIPIQIPEVQDAPLLGSAILAAVASGLYPTVRDGARRKRRENYYQKGIFKAHPVATAMDELRRWWPTAASPGKRKQSVIRFKKQSILSFIERHARGV